jgi:hypothetical protein
MVLATVVELVVAPGHLGGTGSSRPAVHAMTVTMAATLAHYGGDLPRFLANVTVIVGVIDRSHRSGRDHPPS